MGGKLEGQKYWNTPLGRDQNVRLLIVNEPKHSSLQRTKRSSALCAVNENVFMACIRRCWEAEVGEQRQQHNAERFKRTARLYAWLNHSRILVCWVWESVQQRDSYVEIRDRIGDIKGETRIVPRIGGQSRRNSHIRMNFRANMCGWSVVGGKADVGLTTWWSDGSRRAKTETVELRETTEVKIRWNMDTLAWSTEYIYEEVNQLRYTVDHCELFDLDFGRMYQPLAVVNSEISWDSNMAIGVRNRQVFNAWPINQSIPVSNNNAQLGRRPAGTHDKLSKHLNLFKFGACA